MRGISVEEVGYRLVAYTHRAWYANSLDTLIPSLLLEYSRLLISLPLHVPYQSLYIKTCRKSALLIPALLEIMT